MIDFRNFIELSEDAGSSQAFDIGADLELANRFRKASGGDVSYQIARRHRRAGAAPGISIAMAL
jgi:hypothetical protein